MREMSNVMVAQGFELALLHITEWRRLDQSWMKRKFAQEVILDLLFNSDRSTFEWQAQPLTLSSSQMQLLATSHDGWQTGFLWIIWSDTATRHTHIKCANRFFKRILAGVPVEFTLQWPTLTCGKEHFHRLQHCWGHCEVTTILNLLLTASPLQ